jgi:hypothetical protein
VPASDELRIPEKDIYLPHLGNVNWVLTKQNKRRALWTCRLRNLFLSSHHHLKGGRQMIG